MSVDVLNPPEKVTGRARQLCLGTSDVDFLGDLKRDGGRFGFEIGIEMAQRTEVAAAPAKSAVGLTDNNGAPSRT
jgi:hypothetical protein